PEPIPRAEFPAGTLARLSPEGGRLLVAAGRQATLYDTRTGETVVAFEGKADLTAAALSADGATLALGDAGGEVEIWELPSGKSGGRFRTHDGQVRALAFGRDGRLFAGRGKAGEKPGEVEAVRSWQDGRLGPPLAVAGLLSPDGGTLAEDTA